MDNRKWQANAAASPPTPPASPSVGYPTNGGVSTPVTSPGDWMWYALTEEIRNVIVAAGLTPDNTVNQLLTAIKKGFGQTWQNFTGSRAMNTTYTNTTGSTIFVMVQAQNSLIDTGIIILINGTLELVGPATTSTGTAIGIIAPVPPDATYRAMFNVGTPTLALWHELR